MRLHYLERHFQNKISLLFFLLFLPIQVFIGQNSVDNEQPVLKLLKKTARDYNLSFSYNRRDLKDLSCVLPPEVSSLESTLEALERNCNLQFYRIDDRYIAVRVNVEPPISVCGTVIDQQTGAPLKGASIVSPLVQIGVDRGGKFSIEAIAPSEIIAVYYQGFRVKEIEARELQNGTDCPIVFIDQQFTYLPTVLLNSYLTKGITRNAEGSVSISKSNFEILPNLVEPDVLRIAQVLPGIESFNETAANINIRGGKSDETLLLWDGIRMYQSGHFFGLISAINPNLTEHVEIFKNGTPARFGESTSGVISMQSDSEIPEEVTGAASIDFISTHIYAKIPASERFAFHVSGRTSINTGVGNPVYNQFFDRVFQNTVITNLVTNTEEGLRSTDEAFNFYDVNVKGIWELSDHDRIQYNFLTIVNKLQFTERITGDTFLSKNVTELKQNSLINGLSWERNWTTKIRTKLGYNSVNYDNIGASQDQDTGGVESQDNEVNERRFEATLHFDITPSIVLSTGYQFTETNIVNSLSPLDLQEVFTTTSLQKSHAAFFDAKLKLFDNKTVFSGGVRFTSYPELSEQFYEPRLNISQRITPQLNLQASAELKHQAIGQTIDVQNNLLGLENTRWIALGSALSPILKNRQASLGSAFSWNDWQITAEGFLKKVDDLNSGNLGFRNQFLGINALGSYEAVGFEASVSKKTEALNTWLSYTYMDNEYSFGSLDPSSFPSNYNIQHSLSLSASYSWRNFLFSLGINYHSGIPYTPVVAGDEILETNGVATINFNEPNSQTLPEFLRTDFSAAYRLKLDATFTGELNVSIFNVFDRRNALDTYYLLERTEDGESEIARVEEFSLGFTPNVSLRIIF